ncbi:MAG: SCP-like extracellular [Draconibacterium sp.]|nr:SCP-like extracellular [Draconibacterium sp.]
MKIKTSMLCVVIILGMFIVRVQAQSVPDITGSKVTKEEAQTALDFHNKVRADVGVNALTWSPDLAKFAQEWADHLASQGCDMQHRPRTGEWTQKYGENIFWGKGADYSALDASKSWYSEIEFYTHGEISSSNWSKTGHYTQMVWKKTSQVGIAVAKCSDGAIIIVANYDPAGNFMGESPY